MSELFLAVLNMSLTASYVILCVMLIRLPLKKAPKIISYALWGVVAFRLMIPFSFESIFSLIPRNTAALPVPREIIYLQIPQTKQGIEAAGSIVSQPAPAAMVASADTLSHNYVEIGAYLWMIGIIALLAFSLLSVLALKRKLKKAQRIEKNIFEANNLRTPFVLGVIRPRIYLPLGLKEEERSYILLHEETHIRRKDHIVKIAAFFILCIHWFNPLVWLAFLLMSTDMELSCDEKVLKEMGQDIRKPYASSLLSLAAGRYMVNGSPLAFGEGNVKGRIKNVLNNKKPKLRVVVVLIIIAAGVGIGLLLNPKKNETDQAEQINEALGEAVNQDNEMAAEFETKLPAGNINEIAEANEKEDVNRKAGVSLGEDTAVLKALINFYGRTDEALVIYEQIPYDNDYILALADRITDGEHYPNLYLISPNGTVSALTRHSNCWILNFTELGGYKVFFGLAGREADQGNSSLEAVDKVEIIFGNKTETVIPRNGAYAYNNIDEKYVEGINNARGYILIVKNPDMPEEVVCTFADGQRVSLSQKSIERNQSYRPAYLDSKKKSISGSFAFTYSPMISPIEWKQIDAERVSLQGKRDENGNVNMVFLRPSQTVLKTVHSSELPNDMKAFCLSNSYPWIGSFAAGEIVEVVYFSDGELHDCRTFKLTSQSVSREMDSKNFQEHKISDDNQVALPKEAGDYLILIRTEKNFELRSYIGVIHIY